MTDASTWPATVIHVNEDGWVLINRGSHQGVVRGQRLLVVGEGVRELRDLASENGATGASLSVPTSMAPVLTIRRTYEMLEVVYAEGECAVAIATRTPHERRPEVYRGPGGELLVWVPLPEGYTWPPAGGVDDTELMDEADDEEADEAEEPDASLEDGELTDEASGDALPDTPPERGEQEDERWEEALPLNSVRVGALVVPAVAAV